MRIVRLNAFDGLFLRAEHLAAMQEYTRTLTWSLGRAGGSGIVHGYTASLSKDGEYACIEPGLAIAPSGSPILHDTTTNLNLTDPKVVGKDTDARTLLLIVATRTDTPLGKEDVYGDLCAEPLQGTMPPYLAEDAAIRIIPAPLQPPEPNEALTWRSRVASHWFREEHRRLNPWIATAAPPAPDDTRILRADWGKGLPLPASAAPDSVPLALLLRVSNSWVLDPWIVRRERTDPPARPLREGQLALRPWNVFHAQILQFQDMLATRWLTNGAAGINLPMAAPVIQQMRQKLEETRESIDLPSAQENLDAILELVPTAEEAAAATAPPLSLVGSLGIEELPPAGFLPHRVNEQRTAQQQITALFASAATLRFHACPADAALSAVAAAQHLHRIPLAAHTEQDKATVDILVPDAVPRNEDLTTHRPWVAFRRATSRSEELDTIDLYLYEALDAEPLQELVTALTEQRLDPSKPDQPHPPQHLLIHYPAGGYALPAQQSAIERWKRELDQPATAIGLARTEERRNLTGARAAMCLDLFKRTPDRGIRPGDIFATLRTNGHDRDAVVLLKRKPSPPIG